MARTQAGAPAGGDTLAPARPAARARALERLREHWAPLVVGALTLLALGLRLVLVRDSLNGDELFMFNIVHDRSLGDAMSIVRETEKTPPLYFLLVWVSSKLGDPLVWSRLPSLLFGTALVPLAYVLGSRTVGKVAAVVGAGMLALGPFAIFYATENRAYAGVAFLVGLSMFFLLRAIDTRSRGWWAAYVLAVVAVIYTHYIGVFVLLAQTAWAFWTQRERLRELLVVHALIVLAFLPWLPSYLVQQDHSGAEARRIALLVPPSAEYLGNINVRMLLGHPSFQLSEVPGSAAAVLGIALILAAAAAAALRAWRGRAGGLDLSSPIVLLVLATLASPIGVTLLSVRPDMSFMLARNLSASLVPAVLLVAWLLVSLGRRAAIPAVAVMFAILSIGAVQSLEQEKRRTPWREIAEFIDTRARPGDAVLQHFFIEQSGAPGRVLTNYFERPHPFFSTPPAREEDRAWARGLRGAHVFVVWPLAGLLASTEHAAPRDGPGDRFVKVAEVRYNAWLDVLVAEYALREK